MKVLIIPDVHLKPWMFDRADEILKDPGIDEVIQLGDLVDNWTEEPKLKDYRALFSRAAEFAEDHPTAYWCIGNHDISYIWNTWNGSATPEREKEVNKRLKPFYSSIQPGHVAFSFIFDNCIFSHAGIAEEFVNRKFTDTAEVEKTISGINNMGEIDIDCGDSPIFCRPQIGARVPRYAMYKEHSHLQVVGHTPVYRVHTENSVLFCDTFTLPGHSHEFCIVDTKTKDWRAIPAV